MPQTATLTLSLSSPLAPPLPTDLVLFDSLVQGSGLHRIHLVPGAGAGTLELQFSWGPDDRATNLTKALCLNTVGFGLSCLSETEPSQDLTDLFFPASASPERRTVPRHAPHPPRARAGAWCRDPHELGLCRTLAHKAPVALTR